MTKIAPYGSWSSPINAQMLQAKKGSLIELSSDTHSLLYSSRHPKEGVQLHTLSSSAPLLPSSYTPGSRVHEYGGGSFTHLQGITLFSCREDGGLYLQSQGGEPELILKKEGLRFASFALHPSLKWAACVCEDHTQEVVTNALVLIDLELPGTYYVLHVGYDFYASPNFSASGKNLAFIAWKNPNMPWDETKLFVASFDEIEHKLHIEKVFDEEGVCFSEPRYASSDKLAFVSNSPGFAQIMTYEQGKVTQITDEAGDFATPLWVFHLCRFDFISKDKIAAILTKQAIDSLVIVDITKKTCTPLPLPFNDYNQIKCVGDKIYTIAASAEKEAALICIESKTHTYTPALSPLSIGALTSLSKPQPLSIITGSGKTYAFFYPPCSSDFSAPSNEKPPLIVRAHSGPTTHSKPSFSEQIQYWTSRGFAFMEVNYRGSTGYGKPYQEALYGHWAEFDVADTLSATKFVLKEGLANPDKVVIKGSSAGGLTALMCLATSSIFKLGIIYYGIADLEALCAHSDHKFEAHYNSRLLGDTSQKALRAKSPLFHADAITAPLLLLQGGKDVVVPPTQTEAIRERLKIKGVPAYLGFFPEEGHGFRQSKTKRICLEAESYFLSQGLDLTIDGGLKSDAIDWND